MSETAPTQALVTKVLAAAKDSGYVRKASNHAQGYKYADDEAITTKFRDAMISAGVLVYPEGLEFADIQVFPHSLPDKLPNVLVSIKGYLAVTDGAASLKVASLGQGVDRGDKAIYKAMTGFKKYGYRHLVMMATGDDPEASREDERSTNAPVPQPVEQPANGDDVHSTKDQRDELLALATTLNITKDEMGVLRKAHTNKAKSSEFTIGDVAAMKKAVIETAAIKSAAGTGAEVVS